MTVKRTWIVENKWKCDSCGTENLGRFMECQNCRNPKEKQEADVVPDANSASAVTDPELLRLATQGANWVCEYCGGQVRNEYGKCVKNCGAAKPGSGAEEPKLPPDPSFTPERASNPRPEPSKPSPRPAPPGPPDWSLRADRRRPIAKPATLLWVFGGVLGTGAFVWLMVFLFASHETTAQVSGISWQYQQDLHQRTLMHSEGWGSPGGSFNVSCRSKFYGTEKCRPHTCNAHSVSYDCNCTSYDCRCHKSCSDNKNGFSTCSEECDTCQRCSTCNRTEYDTCYDQCDVYKDWCAYDYYEWPIIATKRTTGVSHDEHWADLKADGPFQRLDQTETYEVQFAEKEDRWKYRPRSLAEFRYFNAGVSWRVLVNRVGMIQPQHALP